MSSAERVTRAWSRRGVVCCSCVFAKPYTCVTLGECVCPNLEDRAAFHSTHLHATRRESAKSGAERRASIAVTACIAARPLRDSVHAGSSNFSPFITFVKYT